VSDRRPGVLAITGGASGFGLAVAQRCAAHGMDVALIDLDGDRAAEEAAGIAGSEGVRALGIAADVASVGDLDAAAGRVASELGGCHVLWANVAVQRFGAVEALGEQEWRWVMEVNVLGTVHTVRSFLPVLRNSAQPRLVFTASANALAPAERLGAYQASKYAVVGLAETLRMELSHDGIGVSIVYPSGMMTRHLESSEAARPDTLGPSGDFSGDLEAMMASRPLGEGDLTTAEEAAAVAVEGVLAGEDHVITHGDVSAAVREYRESIDRALALLGGSAG
jgi:NAD(P)-dependent dehydrogenase (short-subunit alcohol dehydrogenase family)